MKILPKYILENLGVFKKNFMLTSLLATLMSTTWQWLKNPSMFLSTTLVFSSLHMTSFVAFRRDDDVDVRRVLLLSGNFERFFGSPCSGCCCYFCRCGTAATKITVNCATPCLYVLYVLRLCHHYIFTKHFLGYLPLNRLTYNNDTHHWKMYSFKK